MRHRGLFLGTLFLAVLVTQRHSLMATGAPSQTDNAPSQTNKRSVLQLFFGTDDSSPTEFRARRHLEARTNHFGVTAWMDVYTEGTSSSLSYTILGEGGSDYIRSHVFEDTLDTERRMWASDAPDRSAITPENYTFEDQGADAAGLARVLVRPKRRDLLLLDGLIFLRPDDGDLVEVQGALSKNPSFWTRRVEITGHYERIAGVRLPVAFESVANVLVVGRSTFTMTYDYEMVNGQQMTHRN
jgi:hypothetical protein